MSSEGSALAYRIRVDVAREIAWLCVAFGMDVAAHSPSLDADEAYESRSAVRGEPPVIICAVYSYCVVLPAE